MCTYDYTPYTGCEAGEQHFFIQWIKCNQAVENGRYCSLEASAQVEQLRKLSANVLSCPLHGPIAVQQYVLEPANAKIPEEEPEKPRARSTARKSSAPASRSRTPARGARTRDVEQPAPRREVRKRRSVREMVAESSDSDSASSFSRHRTERTKKSGNRALVERRQSRTARDSHRRSISADVALLPPPASLARHGRSEVSLPLKSELEPQEEDAQSSFARAQPSLSTSNLDLPRASGLVGLPSSPDMHRRTSMHRSRSENLLRDGVSTTRPELIQSPAARTAMSPSSDSSPDHNPELPFSNNTARRGRRPGPRSVRELSVETAMKRISEHIVQEEDDELVSAAAAAGKPHAGSSPSTTTASPEPQPPHHASQAQSQAGAAHSAPAPAPSRPTSTNTSGHRRTASSHSRPRLNNLQIPKQSHAPPQRDAYSAPTATVPESVITTGLRGEDSEVRSRSRSRTRSLRHAEPSSQSRSAVEPLPMHAHAQGYQLGGYDLRSGMNEETTSPRSTNSHSQARPRRFEQTARETVNGQGHVYGHGQSQVYGQVPVQSQGYGQNQGQVQSQVYGQTQRQHHSPPTALTRSPQMGSYAMLGARMSEPNLAMGGTGLGVVGVGVALPMSSGPTLAGRERESVDSGYRSGHNGYGQPHGHGHQRSWETAKPASGSASVASGSVDSVGGTGSGVVRSGTGKTGRNTLQKAPPASQQQQQQQPQPQGYGSPPLPQHQQRPAPEPLNLAAARLPPCALPVSLMSPLSPGFGQESDGGSVGGKSAKAKLLQRMGLRKKISGMLWDRGGKEVGAVEG